MYKRCLLFFALVFAASAAHADTTTYQVTVDSTTAYGSAGGTYLLTFDPTLVYQNATSGIQVVSNYGSSYAAPTSNVGFYFDPNSENGLLTIGGVNDGDAASVDVDDDFEFSIGSFATGSPVFHEYKVGDGPAADVYSSTGTVTEIAATPEPSSLMLLGTGLLGAVGCVRRRFLA